ncbi:hypothetical protein BH09ACT3_BH09ACT3_03210 [soil metagenome]
MRFFALLLAVASAVGFVVVPGHFRADAAAAVTAVPTTATFSPESNGVLRPGQDLIISGTISNPTGNAVPVGTATVYLDRSTVPSRTDLTDWLGGDSAIDERRGAVIATASTPEVPPGRVASVSITVPAAAVGLPDSTSSWGARTLAVSISTPEAAVGLSRSALVWFPATTAPMTRVAFAVPLTVPGASSGLLDAEALQAYTGPNGALTRQLDQAIGTGVAIGIDPMILASIRILGDSAPLTARTWLERLEAAPNDSFALSYADYDLAAVSQAGAAGPLVPLAFPVDPALFPGATPAPTATAAPSPVPSPTTEPGPTLPTVESLTAFPYTITGIGWPLDDTVVPQDLDWLSAGGMPTSILSSGNVAYKLDYTPSAAAKAGPHGVLVSDAVLSAQFRTAAASTDEASWAHAMAGLSASLATVSRERPGESRTVLVTLDRSSLERNYWLARTVDGLDSVPWVAGVSLNDLTAALTETAVTASVTPQAESADRIAAVGALLSAEQRVTAFSSILADPVQLTGPQRLNLMTALSSSWGHDSNSSGAAMAAFVAGANEATSAVSIADSGGLLITSTNSRISVAITNELAWPVSVYLTVRPRNGNLYIEESRVLTTIEANSQSKIQIPVQALANGRTTIEATLTSPTSVPISETARIEVDVHADWETVFTAVIAVAVVLVFGFGVWRTVAKRRKEKQAAADAETETVQ